MSTQLTLETSLALVINGQCLAFHAHMHLQFVNIWSEASFTLQYYKPHMKGNQQGQL